MYIPKFNLVDDKQKINAFIHAHGFATVLSQSEGKLCASHLPVLLDESANGLGALRSHMARASRLRAFEAKFKLGQNLSEEDQNRMLLALRSSPDSGSRELAQFILAQRVQL